jgi:acyl-CoA synthetase (AMP-forming)/AMP-acid ligase II
MQVPVDKGEGVAALTDLGRIGTIPRMALAASEAYGTGNAIEDGAFTLRYDELAGAVLRSSRAFIAAGIEPGDRVAIWAPNVHEWILAALGLQGAGAVLVPLNTRFKGTEAAYILNKSGARILCTVGDFLGTNYVELIRSEETPGVERVISLRGEEKGVEPWDDFLAGGTAVEEGVARDRIANADASSLSDMMFTSGTTGKPKGVMTEHQQNLRVFEAWTEVIGLRAGDRYLIINPFFHAFGYKAGWMSSLMRGATILPQPVFDVDEVLSRVASDRVSMLPGPPAIYQSILAHPSLADYDISNLRLAVTGAAAVPVELVHRMRDELGFETIVTGYGLTETCGTATMCRHDDDPETIATTSGRAMEGIEVRCVDADGVEVPRGEPGEVVVRGYNLMRGYFDDDTATRETIDLEGWLHTGDVAVMDERGYLRITDRIKDMFIMGGFNCYPAEIESALFEMSGIAAAAVIGVPDERMGEVGMAFVVLEAGAALDEAAIIAWSRENMANYKVPRRVQVLEELPMNASGKVTKFSLREWVENEGAAP